ncbi:Endosulphine [Parasponia andersonii]|uniref:Endosulphine n=1 Tax=Parasponia andersonii TaxID=3476 RepID=A0A2P5BZA8_PARAD|nr:Endosulphine [Parasponia andersonii]
MSGSNNEDPKEQELANNGSENKVGGDISEDDLKTSDKIDESSIPASDKTEENSMPSPQQEEKTIKKKYGGIVPKKPPLISKDHERAYFDSADWALGKQGAQKPKGPLEALRPKLQPTPHHQTRSRRSAYAPADEGEVEGGHTDTSSEEQSTVDGADESNTTT